VLLTSDARGGGGDMAASPLGARLTRARPSLLGSDGIGVLGVVFATFKRVAAMIARSFSRRFERGDAAVRVLD
jgi:hypothetical protein